MIKIEVKDNIYREKVTLIANCSIDEAIDVMDKIAKQKSEVLRREEYQHCSGIFVHTYDLPSRSFIYLEEFDWSPKRIGVLIHECFHLVDYIFSERGVKFDSNSWNEHWSYYFEFWTRSFLEKLEKKVPK